MAAVQEVIQGGEETYEKYRQELADLKQKAGTETIYHPQVNSFGYTSYIPDEQVALKNLTKAEQDRYRLLENIIEAETPNAKYIQMYGDATYEGASLQKETNKAENLLRKTTTKATTTTVKLSDEEKELKNALDRFKKSIKSAQMRMSALKVWSGITNMSEIDILENTIKINDDTINGYYDKLKSVGELTDDETNELKQLIETQKGYRRKLNKLKVDEEERRTNGDFSSLRRGVQSINDVIKQSWDKYINNLQGTELFNVWNNGKTHVDNRYGREDSELIEDYYNDIYEYIKNIEESRKDVSSHFNSMTENPIKVNDTEFITKYQNIVESVRKFLDEYESKNGSIVDLNKVISEYWNKYLTEETDLIDQVLFDAIMKTLYKKREIKNTPDSETLYNMVE